MGNKLHDLVYGNNLFQIIDQPTCITTHTCSATILDLIITDSPGYIQDSGTLEPLHKMDHKIVYASLKFKYPNGNCFKRTVWHYKNADLNGLNNAIQQAPWDASYQIYDEIDDHTQYFSNLLSDITEIYIPKRTITI